MDCSDVLDNDECNAQNMHTLLHPNDPSVEKEYERLAEAWKKQLIKAPSQPTKDFIRLAWIRLMDHYLDQQWLDSKQMLQCAQAWSSQQSISVTQAVHTMKIISLKSMRRSLETRRELLQAFDDSTLMTSFGITNSPTTALEKLIKERLSIANSNDEDTSEGDKLHLPLFTNQLNTSTNETLTTLHDEAIMTPEEINRYIQFIGHDHNRESKVFNGDSKNQSDTDLSLPTNSNKSTSSALSMPNHPRSLMPSNSTPNMSVCSSSPRKLWPKGLNRSYDTYYEKLHQILPWKEFATENDSTISEGNCSTNTDGCRNSNKFNWKSWFHEEEPEANPLIETEAEYCSIKEPFANEKVEADAALMTEFYKNNSTLLGLKIEDCFAQAEARADAVGKETSVSSLRPISNNKHTKSPSATENSKNESNLYPSYVKIGERDLITYSPRCGRKNGPSTVSCVAMAKSNSSPARAKSITNSKSSNAALPESKANSNPSSKERTFTIRNMQKKMSLPKLFGNKKVSAATSTPNV